MQALEFHVITNEKIACANDIQHLFLLLDTVHVVFNLYTITCNIKSILSKPQNLCREWTYHTLCNC